MAASMWKGNISFGLVNIPVKLYTAIDTSKDISFITEYSTRNGAQ
jgi:DNA end-binding protein Ku